MLERHAIGLDNLRLAPADPEAASQAEVAEFRRALVRRKQDLGTYAATEARVSFLGERLFRVTIPLSRQRPDRAVYGRRPAAARRSGGRRPDHAPWWSARSVPGARVFAFAQRHGFAYGLLAVAIAVAAGWLASVAFRRR